MKKTKVDNCLSDCDNQNEKKISENGINGWLEDQYERHIKSSYSQDDDW